jgi:hypothetical protein
VFQVTVSGQRLFKQNIIFAPAAWSSGIVFACGVKDPEIDSHLGMAWNFLEKFSKQKLPSRTTKFWSQTM